jgi:undecaprenyl-diphosphatase
MDIRIIEFIYENTQSPLFDHIMPVISRMGNGGMVWIGIAALLMMCKKYRMAGFMVICALALGAVLGEVILKNIFQRARPFVDAPHFKLLIERPLTRYSFPSGHATSSFAAAGTVLRTVDSALIKGPVLFLACAVAFSRVYLLVHYPSDILGGMLLGLLSAYAVYRLFSRGGNTAGSKTPE